MSKIIIASPASYIKNIKDACFVPTIPVSSLSESMQFHADMQIFVLNNKTVVSCPECFEYYKTQLAPCGIEVLCGEKHISAMYPDDAAYNIAKISKNRAMAKWDKVDPVITEYLKKAGTELINTKQGYTKCSTAIVADNAIITSDKGIYKTALQNNIDVLLVCEGYVELLPYPFGFLGGASGLISENELYFEGNISAHPDFDKINDFLNKYFVKAIYKKKKILSDIGSVICIY